MEFWWSQVVRPNFPDAELDQQWDVVIIGGGFSGLWVAHHLISSHPTMTIAIVEKDRVGSGASGRNGGWVSALYPISDLKLRKTFSDSTIASLHRTLQSSIDEIGEFIAASEIECGYIKGGSLTIARNSGQHSSLIRAGDEEILSASETREQINMDGALGATFTPHCARINPAALVVGLANTVVAKGVSIFENNSAEISKERTVSINGRKVKANFVVRATEAYHCITRDQIPIYSLVVATDPLPQKVFDEIGVRNFQTFAEASHLITYAQRTTDDRLVIGGRGAPYTWGSRRNDAMECREKDHTRLRELARTWFPILREFHFPYAWGGAVAITRDWSPYVRTQGQYGELGGYVGDGVTLSYLAAKAMADIIQGRDSEIRELPFVNRENRLWEPEPLRWLGVNAAIKLTALADREEKRTQRPSYLMKIVESLTGK